MPTIGIIGGCGPLATVDIEKKILEATYYLIKPFTDQDFFNLIVYNNAQFTDRNDDITQNKNLLLNEFIACSKKLINIGIDVLLIACQTAHVYLPNIRKSINVPILDIVQETAKHINKNLPNVKKIGLISTESTKKQCLYQNSLLPYGIEVITLNSSLQQYVMEAIYIIKTGINLTSQERVIKNTNYPKFIKEDHVSLVNHPYKKVLLQQYLPNPVKIIQDAIDYFIQLDCNYIVLGCTELPLLLNQIIIDKNNTFLIDSNKIIADSAVLFASEIKNKYNKRTA